MSIGSRYLLMIKNMMSSLLMSLCLCDLRDCHWIRTPTDMTCWGMIQSVPSSPDHELLAHTDLLLKSNCLKPQLTYKHINNISNLNTSRAVVLNLWTEKLRGAGSAFKGAVKSDTRKQICKCSITISVGEISLSSHQEFWHSCVGRILKTTELEDKELRKQRLIMYFRKKSSMTSFTPQAMC